MGGDPAFLDDWEEVEELEREIDEEEAILAEQEMMDEDYLAGDAFEWDGIVDEDAHFD